MMYAYSKRRLAMKCRYLALATPLFVVYGSLFSNEAFAGTIRGTITYDAGIGGVRESRIVGSLQCGAGTRVSYEAASGNGTSCWVEQWLVPDAPHDCRIVVHIGAPTFWFNNICNWTVHTTSSGSGGGGFDVDVCREACNDGQQSCMQNGCLGRICAAEYRACLAVCNRPARR
jgi:hypothetical protein